MPTDPAADRPPGADPRPTAGAAGGSAAPDVGTDHEWADARTDDRGAVVAGGGGAPDVGTDDRWTDARTDDPEAVVAGGCGD